MSSEVVLLAPIAGAFSLPVAIGLAALAIGILVKNMKDNAEARRILEKARQKKWEEFKEQQHAELEALKLVHQEIQSKTENLGSLTLAKPAARESGDAPSTKGFMDLTRKPAAKKIDLKPDIQKISEFLAALPKQFKSDHDWPYQRFLTESDRISQAYDQDRPISSAEVRSLHETMLRTLNRYLKETADNKRAREKMILQADGLLDDCLLYESLTLDKKRLSELKSIRGVLNRLSESDKPAWGDLDLLTKRLGKLKDEIDAEVQRRAYRRTLADSAVKRLSRMGYEEAEPFVDDDRKGAQGIFAIPGGQRLRARILNDGRMTFKVAPDKWGALSREDIASFRRQEDKWCKDFRELLRGLVEDGFSFSIEREENTAEESIPIADVISADELAEEEDMQTAAAPKARTRDE